MQPLPAPGRQVAPELDFLAQVRGLLLADLAICVGHCRCQLKRQGRGAISIGIGHSTFAWRHRKEHNGIGGVGRARSCQHIGLHPDADVLQRTGQRPHPVAVHGLAGSAQDLDHFVQSAAQCSGLHRAFERFDPRLRFCRPECCRQLKQAIEGCARCGVFADQPTECTEFIGALVGDFHQRPDGRGQRGDIRNVVEPHACRGALKAGGRRAIDELQLCPVLRQDQSAPQHFAVALNEQALELFGAACRRGAQKSLRIQSNPRERKFGRNGSAIQRRLPQHQFEVSRKLVAARQGGDGLQIQFGIGGGAIQFDPVEQFPCVAKERAGTLAIYDQQAAKFVRDHRPLALDRRVLRCVENDSTFQAVKEEKDQPDVAVRMRPSLRQPAQISASSLRRDVAIARPIAGVLIAEISRACNMKQPADQARLRASTVGRFQPSADVKHPAGQIEARDADGLTRTHPVGFSRLGGRLGDGKASLGCRLGAHPR